MKQIEKNKSPILDISNRGIVPMDDVGRVLKLHSIKHPIYNLPRFFEDLPEEGSTFCKEPKINK